MKLHPINLLILSLLLLSGVFLNYKYPPQSFSGTSQHIGVAQAYPNPKLTPGLVATTDFKELTAVTACGTYSQCHRQTTASMKTAVCKEYPQNCNGTQETDHFCPLALGCADDIRNLWAEPEHIIVNGEDWGWHTKDRIETQMVLLMKAGKISPSDAQNCILNDWIKCYKDHIKGNAFGGLGNEDLDGDFINK